MTKALRVPIDRTLVDSNYTPYTISFVIKKRGQIDHYNELPENKRPPDDLIWDGSAEELEDWMNRVLKKNEPQTIDFDINEDEIG